MGSKKMFFGVKNPFNPNYLIEDFEYYGESILLDQYAIDFCFNNTGTKVFVYSSASGYNIKQYSLSVPYDITTMSYDSKMIVTSTSFGFRGWGGVAMFRSDDSKLIICGSHTSIAGSGLHIAELTFGVHDDVSTLSIGNVARVNDTTDEARGMTIFEDNKIVLTNAYATQSPDSAFQYDMSSPMDISTLSFSGFSHISNDQFPFTSSFMNNGYHLLVAGSERKKLYQYETSIRGNLIGLDGLMSSLDVSAYGSHDVYGLNLNPEGNKVYLIRRVSRKIYQYSLP